MRCPVCGSDTTPGLPRCTHCNALLGTSPPPGPQPPTEYTAPDHTTPEYPPPPIPPPIPPYGPPPPNPDYTAPMPPNHEYTAPMGPPSEETSTLLSAEPWSEPAIWQPPAPPKKSKAPYLLLGAGLVVLAGLALGIVFWPSGPESNAGPGSGGGPSAQQSQSVVSESEPPASEASGAQAKEVDALLAEMGTTRSDLGAVVVGGCETSGLQRVLDARRSQLEKARALDVGALANGAPMKEALVRALEASSESNQRYLDAAPGCPSDGEVADVNQRASDAKNEFIGYWTPLAREAGLPARTANDI